MSRPVNHLKQPKLKITMMGEALSPKSRERLKTIFVSSGIGVCQYCGQISIVMADKWGRGPGGLGGRSAPAPIAFEPANPRQHCICVGGPVWRQLVSTPFGRDTRMIEAESRWRQLPEIERRCTVLIYAPQNQSDEGCWMAFRLETWRAMLLEHWGDILAHE